jgi:hypothetical protein
VGIPDLPLITRAFVDKARASVPVHVLVGAPSALASHFDSLGSVVPDAWEGETLGLPEAAIRVVSGPGDQADEVLEGLVRVARGRSPDQVTIGAPDRTVVPYVVERLGEEGIHARYAGGRDIERTGPFRLLHRVADFLEERRFDAFAELIRHPDLERRLSPLLGDIEDTPPAVVDRYRAIHLPARLEEGWLPMGGEAYGHQPGPAFRLLRDGLLDALKPLKGSRRLSEWSAPIRRTLEECYGSGALDRGTERGREILEAMSGIGRALEEMEALAVDLDDFVPAHRALRVVIDSLVGTSIPPPPGDQAIDVLGWLELALDDAPVLLITGVNEPYLPESVSSDPFLPHALQQALGLLDNRGRWARDLLHARTIVATRKEALFIAGRQDGDGNPLWVSRLLLAEPPGIAARRIRAFLGPGAVHGRSRKLARGAGAPLTLPPEPILSSPLPPERVRVTAFRELLADPYRYALERVLGLEGSNDTAREMGPAPFGTLAHVVLQGYGRGGTARLTEPREIRNALDQLLEQEARSRFGTRPLPAVALQVEQLRGRLRAFAKWQAEWVQHGWRLRYVERSFTGADACLLVDGRPTVLSGKVDRIDENEETGVWCILDYKTGERALAPDAVHRRGSGRARRWVDLQLPLYRHLAPALLDDGGVPILPPGAIGAGALRVGYVCLPRDPRTTGERWAEWSDAELDDAIETAREVVRALRANRFEHDPESSTIRVGDPLAPVMGGGILRLEDVEGAEDA